MRMLLSAVVGVSLLAVLMGSIDPGTFECEEAVAHLKDCCGDGATAVDQLTCGSGCSPTQFTLNDGHCIRTTSCADLIALNGCEHPADLACK